MTRNLATPLTQQQLKQQAAEYATEFVESGMLVGLGTGSTAILAVRRIGQLMHEGKLKNIVGIPTSIQTKEEAQRVGIPLLDEALPRSADLTIDGADEVDPSFNLIKGGGGALLREKIVAQASRREIIIVDESKMSPHLGTRFFLPVEVLQFGWLSQKQFLEGLGAKIRQRVDETETPILTDSGNYILDANLGPIQNPEKLAQALEGRAGIVEHGLFVGLATDVIVAGSNGVRHLQRPSKT